MSHTVVLDLPEETLLRYQKGAEAARKPLEEFLVDRLKEAAPSYNATSEEIFIVSAEPAGQVSNEHPKPRALLNVETQLLQQINLGFEEEEWILYRELVAKRRRGILQPDEQQQLIQFTDRLERANARRIGALVELARIRHMDLDALMDELGILSPGYE